jgi:predicted ester cyclase
MKNSKPPPHAQHKQFVRDAMSVIAACPFADTRERLRDAYQAGAKGLASHPMNELSDIGEMETTLWRPLKHAFPDLERTDSMVVAGNFESRDMVACLGHYQGTFLNGWLGIPPTFKATWLRYGEVHALEGGRISHSWFLIDILDVMRQAGVWPLPDSLGAEHVWPSPAGGRGIDLENHDAQGGQASMELVRKMHAELGKFDGKSLRSIDHARYWTKNFCWYGPSGIGTTRGLAGFEAHHQIPFLTAFPDRQGGQHYVRIADGPFVVTGGWPSVTATHTGNGWLGMPATGKRVGMRVMDFYRCENGLIAENWVPIDILHILHQMGYDALARLSHLCGNPKRTLD